MWHLKVEGTNNAKGKVTPIPWQVTYGGTGTDSTVVSEGPIQDKDANGNPIASIDIPSSAANVTIHAVGGGGAGGAADKSSMNAYLDPKGKGAASQEIKELKKILAQRVREAAEKKGFTDFASKSDDDIVLVTDDRDFGIKNANFQGKTIAINTNNGTISGIFDTRTGFVFPDEILDYTEVLGSKSQDSVLYDMPQWFKWGTITQPQTGRLPFLATVYTCDSTAGGSAGDIIFHSNKDVQRCLQKKCTKNYTNSSTCNDDKTVKRYTCSIDDDGTGEPDSQTVCNTRKLSNAGYSCSKVGTSCTESTCSGGYCNKTFFDCSACKANNSAKTSVYQSNSNDLKDYKMNGSCSTSALGKDCLKVKENNCAKRTENLYTTIFAGGKGGAKGPGVYASVIVTGKVSASKTCDRQGGVSGDSTKYTITGNEFGTGKSGVVGNNGMDGVDCTVQISSEGGGSDSSTV